MGLLRTAVLAGWAPFAWRWAKWQYKATRIVRNTRVLNHPVSLLRRIFKWEIRFVETGSLSEVRMLYTINTEIGIMRVEIDTMDLPSTITEVEVMNGQGAHVFDRYLDSSGIALEREEIGCWDLVSAGEAWFESTAHKVSFRLGQVEGARLFRGRELVDSRLAWAGFGYSFPPSLGSLKYQLKIEKLP